MPPKRKATAAKAEAEVVEANGSESAAVPSKAKRGKATKPSADVEEVVKKSTRSTRAKAAPVAEEKQVTEAETKKEKKTAKGKAAAVESDEVAPKKKKEAKAKKATPTKKPKSSDTKATAKAKSTRGAKKGNEDMEKPKPSTKVVAKKKRKSVLVEAEKLPKPKKAKAPATKSAPKADGELLNQVDTDYSSIDFACHKENAAGKPPNFKISSWNVDGIRAWLKKKGNEYIEHEEPDILCLQETKCARDKIPDELNKLMGYKTYWCSGEKEGYAGVAVFTKVDPLSVEYGIGSEEFDDEGRCITAEYEEFYLVNVYVPNAGRKLVTLPKRLEWNAVFKDFIAKLDEKKPVILCGDMNVAHNEIDLSNPKSNKRNAGFTQEERDGFTEFLEDQYVDTYRHLYPDQKNAYTFWSYMSKARSKDIGWRLDYFITSKRFVEKICDNVIRTNVYGSDHCPITLYLNV